MHSVQVCATLWPVVTQATVHTESPWDSPGKNTGVVAIPFSRGSSQPRGRMPVSYVSCISKQVLYYSCRLEGPHPIASGCQSLVNLELQTKPL